MAFIFGNSRLELLICFVSMSFFMLFSVRGDGILLPILSLSLFFLLCVGYDLDPFLVLISVKRKLIFPNFQEEV